MRKTKQGIIAATFAILFMLGTAGTVSAENLVQKAKSLKQFYKKSDLWAMKAIALVSLSDVHHPEAVRSYKIAFKKGDLKVKLYAVEGLSRMPKKVLASGMDKELLNLLIPSEVERNNAYYSGRVKKAVEKATGKSFESADDVKSWWSSNEKSYKPAKWTGGVAGDNSGESPDTAAMIGKLIDLKNHGLDMAIVMDATGSMRKTIQAAKNGVRDLAKFIHAITPKFRMGLVRYRDDVKVEQHFTKQLGRVKRALDDLAATGGGDKPEAVGKGLKSAYMKLKWRRKAGKAVIVVGDAPPHDVEKCKKMAEKANKNPTGKKEGPRTGGDPEDKIPPFITSCIATPSAGGSIASETTKAFKAIAKKGGGQFAKLKNTKNIVKQILKLSFSGNWKKQIDKFVDWTYLFKEKGLW